MEHKEWWSVYGPFRRGEGNLPHMGDVFAHYFQLSGMTLEELSERTGYAVRTIKFFKSRDNENNPDSLSRRRALLGLFGIPPALLGLTHEAVGQNGNAGHLSTQDMEQYEAWLASVWQLYYTASIQTCAQSIQHSLLNLDTAAKKNSGVKKDQIDFMRSRFYQVASVVQRDQGRHNDALRSVNIALQLAERLTNPKLIAASLLRRARVLLGKNDYTGAYQDTTRMQNYVEYCNDSLKGKCLQMIGEATSFVAGADRILQQESLRYFDQALKVARRGNLDPDGSFVRTDLTSILIEKGDALRMFGQYDEALRTLALARKSLSPEQHRWQINLSLTEASTYLDMGDIEHACMRLQDALPLVRAVKLPTKEEAIMTYFQQAKTQEPAHPALLPLERAFIASAKM